MKRQTLVCSVIAFSCVSTSAQIPFLDTSEECKVIVEPRWQELAKNSKECKLFGDEWVLIGNITFKKRSREGMSLSTLHLQWHGDPLENMLASLYKKNPEKDFMPIEENLVSDSCWNKKEQKLILNFKKKETLGVLNIFCLVLTIPQDTKDAVQTGYFTVATDTLPEAFQKTAQTTDLTFAPTHLHQKPIATLARR